MAVGYDFFAFSWIVHFSEDMLFWFLYNEFYGIVQNRLQTDAIDLYLRQFLIIIQAYR